jgi:hypothetical protein
VVSSCKHINCGEIHDHVSDYQLLKWSVLYGVGRYRWYRVTNEMTDSKIYFGIFPSMPRSPTCSFYLRDWRRKVASVLAVL